MLIFDWVFFIIFFSRFITLIDDLSSVAETVARPPLFPRENPLN